MASRKCFVYCNDCSDFITHDNTQIPVWQGKAQDKDSIFCKTCNNVISFNKNDLPKKNNFCCGNNVQANKHNFCCGGNLKKNNFVNNGDSDEDSVCDKKFVPCQQVLCQQQISCDDSSDDFPCKEVKCRKIKCKPVCKPVCRPICCETAAESLISVRDPTTDIFATSPPLVDLIGWTDLIIDARDSFDNLTGTYTAHCAGDYEIETVINYRTAFPIVLDTGVMAASVLEPDTSGIPKIELYDVATGRVLAATQFPVTDIIVPIPCCSSSSEPPIEIEIKTIVAAAFIVIDVVLSLLAGQRIRLRYNSNGLILPLPLPIPIGTPVIDLSPPGTSTTLSIKKLRNSPVVTITV